MSALQSTDSLRFTRHSYTQECSGTEFQRPVTHQKSKVRFSPRKTRVLIVLYWIFGIGSTTYLLKMSEFVTSCTILEHPTRVLPYLYGELYVRYFFHHNLTLRFYFRSRMIHPRKYISSTFQSIASITCLRERGSSVSRILPLAILFFGDFVFPPLHHS